MKITYDEFGRFSEIKFDENDNPEAFWKNWSNAVAKTQEEITARAKNWNEEMTKQTQMISGFRPV